MRVTVKIRIADSVEAEEAAGRTGQPFPTYVVVELVDELVDLDTEAAASDELAEMGFGGLEFEILEVI